MKIGKFELDNGLLLKLSSGLIGLAGIVISNLVSANDQKKLKAEIEEDVFKKLTKGGN